MANQTAALFVDLSEPSPRVLEIGTVAVYTSKTIRISVASNTVASFDVLQDGIPADCKITPSRFLTAPGVTGDILLEWSPVLSQDLCHNIRLLNTTKGEEYTIVVKGTAISGVEFVRPENIYTCLINECMCRTILPIEITTGTKVLRLINTVLESKRRRTAMQNLCEIIGSGITTETYLANDPLVKSAVNTALRLFAPFWLKLTAQHMFLVKNAEQTYSIYDIAKQKAISPGSYLEQFASGPTKGADNLKASRLQRNVAFLMVIFSSLDFIDRIYARCRLDLGPLLVSSDDTTAEMIVDTLAVSLLGPDSAAFCTELKELVSCRYKPTRTHLFRPLQNLRDGMRDADTLASILSKMSCRNALAIDRLYAKGSREKARRLGADITQVLSSPSKIVDMDSGASKHCMLPAKAPAPTKLVHTSSVFAGPDTAKQVSSPEEVSSIIRAPRRVCFDDSSVTQRSDGYARGSGDSSRTNTTSFPISNLYFTASQDKDASDATESDAVTPVVSGVPRTVLSRIKVLTNYMSYSGSKANTVARQDHPVSARGRPTLQSSKGYNAGSIRTRILKDRQAENAALRSYKADMRSILKDHLIEARVHEATASKPKISERFINHNFKSAPTVTEGGRPPLLKAFVTAQVTDNGGKRGGQRSGDDPATEHSPWFKGDDNNFLGSDFGSSSGDAKYTMALRRSLSFDSFTRLIANDTSLEPSPVNESLHIDFSTYNDDCSMVADGDSASNRHTNSAISEADELRSSSPSSPEDNYSPTEECDRILRSLTDDVRTARLSKLLRICGIDCPIDLKALVTAETSTEALSLVKTILDEASLFSLQPDTQRFALARSMLLAAQRMPQPSRHTAQKQSELDSSFVKGGAAASMLESSLVGDDYPVGHSTASASGHIGADAGTSARDASGAKTLSASGAASGAAATATAPAPATTTTTAITTATASPLGKRPLAPQRLMADCLSSLLRYFGLPPLSSDPLHFQDCVVLPLILRALAYRGQSVVPLSSIYFTYNELIVPFNAAMNIYDKLNALPQWQLQQQKVFRKNAHNNVGITISAIRSIRNELSKKLGSEVDKVLPPSSILLSPKLLLAAFRWPDTLRIVLLFLVRFSLQSSWLLRLTMGNPYGALLDKHRDGVVRLRRTLGEVIRVRRFGLGIVALQSRWRGVALRRRVFNYPACDPPTLATFRVRVMRIQAALRGRVSRKHTQRLRADIPQRCAVIQRVCKRIRRERLLLAGAADYCDECRRNAALKRAVGACAVVAQTKLCMKEYLLYRRGPLRDAVRKAKSTVQNLRYGGLATAFRAYYQLLLQRATRIQRLYRATTQRDKLRRAFTLAINRYDDAAYTIQTVVRRRLVYRAFEQCIEKKKQAALLLQRCCRRRMFVSALLSSASDYHLSKKLASQAAAILLLQAHLRRALAVRRARRLRRGILVLQAFERGIQARRQYPELKENRARLAILYALPPNTSRTIAASFATNMKLICESSKPTVLQASFERVLIGMNLSAVMRKAALRNVELHAATSAAMFGFISLTKNGNGLPSPSVLTFGQNLLRLFAELCPDAKTVDLYIRSRSQIVPNGSGIAMKERRIALSTESIDVMLDTASIIYKEGNRPMVYRYVADAIRNISSSRNGLKMLTERDSTLKRLRTLLRFLRTKASSTDGRWFKAPSDTFKAVCDVCEGCKTCK